MGQHFVMTEQPVIGPYETIRPISSDDTGIEGFYFYNENTDAVRPMKGYMVSQEPADQRTRGTLTLFGVQLWYGYVPMIAPNFVQGKPMGHTSAPKRFKELSDAIREAVQLGTFCGICYDQGGNFCTYDLKNGCAPYEPAFIWRPGMTLPLPLTAFADHYLESLLNQRGVL